MATTPDIRVRLSAQGVQEVVAALKAVQTQAQQTGKAAQSANTGFTALTGGVTNLAGAVKALAAAAVVVHGVQLGKHLIDDAAAMNTLAGVTGQTVEQLSHLQYAAAQAGVPFDTLKDALKDFSERAAEAANGGGEAAGAFLAMGIKVKDSQGNLKSQAQLLNEVAAKFATYRDGAAKTTLAIKLFGDNGVQLLPVLNQGAEGLRQMGEQADKMGATLSTKAAKEAAEFKSNIAQLATELTAFAREIMGPVVSALTTITSRFTQARRGGEGFLSSLRTGLFGGEGFRKSIEEAEADLKKLQDYQAGAPNRLMMKLGADDPYVQRIAAAKKNLEDLRKAADDAKAALDVKTKPGASGATDGKVDAPLIPGSAGNKDAQAKAAALALAKAKLDGERALAAQELALTKSRLAATSEANEQAYKTGLASLQAYHATRLSVITAENAAELDAAKANLAAAEALPTKDKAEEERKTTTIAAAKAEVQQRELEGTLKLAQANAAYADELKSLNEQRAVYTRQALEQTGKQRDAAVLALDDEVRKYDELLRKIGTVAAERKRLTDELRARGIARLDFDQAQRDSTGLEATEFDRRKAAVARELASGKLWTFEAEAKTLAIEKERIAVLDQIAERMRSAAEASGDSALIQQARDFASAVDDMRVATDEYGLAVAKLRSGVEESVAGGLSTMLDSIIDGTASAKDAVRAFAFDVVNSIRKIGQELLVQQAIKSFFGAFGGGVGGYSVGGVVKAATGGHIAGPGTGTSDSIPAWLSNGEFVVRAAVVKQPGVLDALHSLNRGGRLPALRQHNQAGAARFADGGLAGSLRSVGSDSSPTSRLEIGLDSGLILKTLESSAGQTAVVKAMGAKRRAARQMGF